MSFEHIGSVAARVVENAKGKRADRLASIRAQAMIDLAVAIHPPISKATFLGRQRPAKVVARRHAVMWLLYQKGLSSPQIGEALHRHHATVMHGRDRVDGLLDAVNADALRAMQDAWAIKWTEDQLCR